MEENTQMINVNGHYILGKSKNNIRPFLICFLVEKLWKEKLMKSLYLFGTLHTHFGMLKEVACNIY